MRTARIRSEEISAIFFPLCFPHLSVAVYDTETVDGKSGLQLIRTVSFDRAMECDANKEG